MKKTLMICAAILALAACTPEKIEPMPTPTGENWPLPANRTGYVVTKITWYDNANNHKEATYEYDENNRLTKRTVNSTYEEWDGIKHNVWVDSVYYKDGRVYKITQTVTPDDDLWHSDRLFYYDDEGRLVRTKYGYNITCFTYRNGRLDSIYSPEDPEAYATLEYDERGNITKVYARVAVVNMIGEPTGEYEMRTLECEYDNSPRPNFNMDDVFAYEPIFGMSNTYSEYIRNYSQNNMTHDIESLQTWEYEYNEQGLPKTMYYQYADVVPENHPVFRFTYRRVE